MRENDLVLLRDKKPGSNYKIADKWVEGVYEVVEKRKDGPVFRLCPIGGGVEQIVHRNMIHPARSVIREEDVGGRGCQCYRKLISSWN